MVLRKGEIDGLVRPFEAFSISTAQRLDYVGAGELRRWLACATDQEREHCYQEAAQQPSNFLTPFVYRLWMVASERYLIVCYQDEHCC